MAITNPVAITIITQISVTITIACNWDSRKKHLLQSQLRDKLQLITTELQ